MSDRLYDGIFDDDIGFYVVVFYLVAFLDYAVIELVSAKLCCFRYVGEINGTVF